MKTTASLITVVVAFATSSANADHRHEIAGLASSVKRSAIRVSRELDFGFRGSRNFRTMRAYNFEVYETADHLVEATVHGEPTKLMHRDVKELAYKLDHVTEILDEMKTERSAGRERISFFGGSVHVRVGDSGSSYRLRRLCETVAGMQEAVHELKHATGQCSCKKFSKYSVSGGIVAPRIPSRGHDHDREVEAPRPTRPSLRRSFPSRTTGRSFGSRNGRFSVSLFLR
jgi:hypothetical protein